MAYPMRHIVTHIIERKDQVKSSGDHLSQRAILEIHDALTAPPGAKERKCCSTSSGNLLLSVQPLSWGLSVIHSFTRSSGRKWRPVDDLMPA
jgi:hypothetical protein